MNIGEMMCIFIVFLKKIRTERVGMYEGVCVSRHMIELLGKRTRSEWSTTYTYLHKHSNMIDSCVDSHLHIRT